MSYDAVLLLGFGGPEALDEVRPFLERVTAGRGIPPERLDEVGHHYVTLGGVSPINAQNRALRDALAAALADRDHPIPVVLANRNSPPFVKDVLSGLVASGAHRLLALATSAYSSYSSCRQYRQDVGAALEGFPGLGIVKVQPFPDLPGFIEAAAEALVPVLTEPGRRPYILVTTHSIPMSMARTSGPEEGWPADPGTPGTYVTQHLAVAEAAVTLAAERAGVDVPPWRLVFQSRSGPPAMPWLEPDVNDVLAELAAAGVKDVVAAPMGFLSDHVEVVWDLDTEAAATASELGIRFTRVPTVGTHPIFVGGLADLLVRHLDSTPPRPPGPGELCFGNCCAPQSRPGVSVDGRPSIQGVVA
jgi:protoporphyrin/coproporphyrin ferrochelatase